MVSENKSSPQTTNNPPGGSYAPVNGLKLYYEIHGAGKPLILLHGGFGVIGMFAPLLPELARTRRVIAVELQAHGHTADIDRPFSYEAMADDIAALIEHLGLERADVLGYSLGGGVAQQTVIRHPDKVRRLIIVSAPCRRTGWYPEVLAGMGSIDAAAMSRTIMYDAYAQVAPKPEGFTSLANKTRQLLATDYDWTAAFASIKSPVLIVAADADSISPAHIAEMFGLLGGGKGDSMSGRPHSQLAILPATTHYDILTRAELLLPIIAVFLDAPQQPT